jgi:exonuclease SbcC
MKNITLKKISLRNFKGVKKAELNFAGSFNIITGKNEAAKSTIEDAWSWCLTGKDTFGRDNYGIRPTDENGATIHKTDIEVELTLDLNGYTRVFKKVQKEKWSKKRGYDTEELTGNETNCYIDDVPYSATDYSTQIAAFFINEDTIRTLSNINAFNQKEWAKQRQILTQISPKFDNEIVFVELLKTRTPEQVEDLKLALANGKTIEQYKAQMQNQLKLAKDALDGIPARIDENDRNLVSGIDFAKIELEVAEKEAKINQLEEQLNNLQLAINEKAQIHQKAISEQMAVQNQKKVEKSNLETKLATLQRNRTQIITQSIDDKKQEIIRVNSLLQNEKGNDAHWGGKLSSIDTEIANIKSERESLINEWKALKGSQFVDVSLSDTCPTCSQKYPTETIEQSRVQSMANWNNRKVSQLTVIENKGSDAKIRLDRKENELATCKDELLKVDIKIVELNNQKTALEAELQTLQTNLQSSIPTAEEISLKAEIDAFVIPELNLSSDNYLSNDDTFQDKQAIAFARAEIDELKNKLNQKSVNEKVIARRNELLSEQKTLNLELLDKEGKLSAINMFIKITIQSIEDSVNQMFSYVKFKLFETQINGLEKEICQCTVDGVVYGTVNTAGRVNAGIDIIKTLSNFYELQLPIFVDNKESAHKLLSYSGQLICLQAVEGMPLSINGETVNIDYIRVGK